MCEVKSFFDICKKIRFGDDMLVVANNPDASKKLNSYAYKMRSTGLLITKNITPKLNEMLLSTSERLLLPSEPEAYVVSDPIPNAYAPVFGVENKPLIILTSGIVELLTPLELQFVIGHELGHLGLGHPGIPATEYNESELQQLKRLSLARAAEISADRIGLIATRSLMIAASVKIKLASGLTAKHLNYDVQAFINQIERDLKGSHEWELYQMHPSLPIRLWSLIQFSKTSVYLGLTKQGKRGDNLEDIDAMVSKKLANLGNGKLTKLEQNKFDLVMTWLGAAMVFDDKVIEAYEEKLLINLVGKELAKKALKYAKEFGLTAVFDKLKSSLNELDLSDNRIKTKIMNGYKLFTQQVNIEGSFPKVKSIISQYIQIGTGTLNGTNRSGFTA